MMSVNNNALEAARLYGTGNDKTFKQIAGELNISNSYAQVLVRQGIELLSRNSDPSNSDESLKNNNNTPPALNVTDQKNILENMNYHRQLPQNQRPESYELETSGIPKRIVLTPKALIIFNVWTNQGFTGDLSDFIEDAIDFMYSKRTPTDRMNYR